MNQHPGLTKKYQAALLALLGLAIFAPVLFRAAALAWLPDWLGAAIAVAALFGALLVFQRAGAMRTGYVVLFAVALAWAAAIGLHG